MFRSALMLSLSFQAFSVMRAADILPTMKKTNDTALPPEESLADLAHFAWCALVGLRLAQQDGQALSPLTTHTFLLRWLAAAQKQRRLPRSVALDIDSLLRLGRQKGLAADLQQRLQYLLDSCSNPVSQQSDLFRLTHAIEYLRSQGGAMPWWPMKNGFPDPCLANMPTPPPYWSENPNCSGILPNRAGSLRRWILWWSRCLMRGRCVMSFGSHTLAGVSCRCCHLQTYSVMQWQPPTRRGR